MRSGIQSPIVLFPLLAGLAGRALAGEPPKDSPLTAPVDTKTDYCSWDGADGFQVTSSQDTAPVTISYAGWQGVEGDFGDQKPFHEMDSKNLVDCSSSCWTTRQQFLPENNCATVAFDVVNKKCKFYAAEPKKITIDGKFNNASSIAILDRVCPKNEIPLKGTPGSESCCMIWLGNSIYRQGCAIDDDRDYAQSRNVQELSALGETRGAQFDVKRGPEANSTVNNRFKGTVEVGRARHSAKLQQTSAKETPLTPNLPALNWKPFIHPEKLDISPDGSKISFETVAGSGWWRTSHQQAADGPFVGIENNKPLKDVEQLHLKATAKLEGTNTQLITTDDSDQGCLFLYVTDALWIKIGLESILGKTLISCVVADPYVDWSQHPIDSEPDAVHSFGIEVREHPGESVPLITLTYNGRTLRQIPAFGAAQHDQAETQFKIGVMGCSPLSSGCKVTFEGIEFQSD